MSTRNHYIHIYTNSTFIPISERSSVSQVMARQLINRPIKYLRTLANWIDKVRRRGRIVRSVVVGRKRFVSGVGGGGEIHFWDRVKYGQIMWFYEKTRIEIYSSRWRQGRRRRIRSNQELWGQGKFSFPLPSHTLHLWHMWRFGRLMNWNRHHMKGSMERCEAQA